MSNEKRQKFEEQVRQVAAEKNGDKAESTARADAPADVKPPRKPRAAKKS